MDETNLDGSANTDLSVRNRPAVGIPISPQTAADAVAGAILRAHRNGHEVLVAHQRPTNDEAIEFATQLGATVVEVDGRASTNDGPPTELTHTARMAGFPGLLWQGDPTQQIDFEKGETAIAEGTSYAIEAPAKSVVCPEPEVLVAIPAYNEGRTIEDVVSGAKPYTDEVLVIDDGSDDGTAACAAQAGATVIEHETNRGYGATLKTAFCEADRSGASHLVVLDGDGQHEPGDIPRLLEAQTNGEVDIVIASRYAGDGGPDVPLYRRAGLWVVNLLTNLSLGVVRSRSRVRDTQSGFRAYDRNAVTSLAGSDEISDHMGASTDILHHAHEHGFEIEEVGARIKYDVENGSNRNPVQHGITLLMNLIHTIERQRPISALGVPGFVSAFIGLGFGYWTVQHYIHSGSFSIGMALTSSFFALAGILAAFTAIILHSLNTQLPD